eukprot:2486242-Prymnesium_polylepis.1
MPPPHCRAYRLLEVLFGDPLLRLEIGRVDLVLVGIDDVVGKPIAHLLLHDTFEVILQRQRHHAPTHVTLGPEAKLRQLVEREHDGAEVGLGAQLEPP